MTAIPVRADLDVPQNCLPYFEICKSASEFVYVVQVHNLRGVDVAMWCASDEGVIRHIARATGAVYIDPSDIKPFMTTCRNRSDKLSELEIKSVLRQIVEKNTRLQIERDELVSCSEFEAISELVHNIQCSRRGPAPLLGAERDVRVVASLAMCKKDVCLSAALTEDMSQVDYFQSLLHRGSIGAVPDQLICIASGAA